MTKTDDLSQRIVEAFSAAAGLATLPSEVTHRVDGDFLTIQVRNPTERLFTILQQTMAAQFADSPFVSRVALVKRLKSAMSLNDPEVALLQRSLSESITIGRSSLGTSFKEKYVRSLFGAEDQLDAQGNHVVFGRRGSGKSSLMLFVLQRRLDSGLLSVWVGMQAYERRKGLGVVLDVLTEIVDSLEKAGLLLTGVSGLQQRLAEKRESSHNVTEEEIRKLVPDFRAVVRSLVEQRGAVSLFLDDFHLVERSVQPLILSIIYSCTRGEGVSVKVSGIENLTRLRDENGGWQVPGDCQVIRLDYNLTQPEKARQHIASILSRHAEYSGLGSIDSVCPRSAVDRLVWVAAGVPRDAIYVFLQGLTKARLAGRPYIAITDVNQAAAETVDEKMTSLRTDVGEGASEYVSLLDRIKEFCLREHKQNAFLTRIDDTNAIYQQIRTLIDLRFLHVLSPSLTPSQAGQRYVALLLDYGLYVQMRAPKSVSLFKSSLEPAKYAELRNLPVFEG